MDDNLNKKNLPSKRKDASGLNQAKSGIKRDLIKRLESGVDQENSIDQSRCDNALNEIIVDFSQYCEIPDKSFSIKFVDGKNKVIPSLIAFVKEDFESHKDKIIGEGWITQKRIMNRFLNINIPDDYYEEFENKFLSMMYGEFGEMFPEIEEVDIVLYGKSLGSMDANNIKGYIAHEVFHLLEAHHGIRYNPSIIREGTATFIQYFFTGNRIGLSQQSTYESLAYNNMAYFIADFFKKNGEKNPIKALLEGKYKEEIELIYAEKLQGIIDKEGSDINHYWTATQSARKNRLLSDPDYGNFMSEPSLDNLLSAFNKGGFPKYAGRLRSQKGSKDILKIYRSLREDVYNSKND